MMKRKINNKADCFNFIKSMEGMELSEVNERINNLDIISKIYLLKYCKEGNYERKNSKKFI